MKKRNKTIIKADRIEHLDVARVHNPRTRRNAADILQQGVKAGLLPAGLVTDLQRLEEGRFPADPARRANLLQRATKLRNDLVYQNLLAENLLGEAVQRALFDVIARQQRQLRSRSNPKRPVRKIAFKTNKRGQLQAFIYVMGGGISRWNRIGLEDARQRLATGEAVKVDFDSMLTPSTVGKTYQPSWEEDIPIVSKYINPAEKDPEHPIEVTRHFRGGPPGYLSPWQKAMAIGQQELFETGIKLAPRAAELRAARLSNPGATKPVYQSGLKQATAAQLPRLARVGLRVGRTPAEIRSDLATTGRFTAEQIRRAIDQATTAERRSNPGFSIPDYKATPKLKKLLETYYNIRLQYRQRTIPKKSPWYLKEAQDEAKADVEYILSRLGDEEYTIKLTQDAIRNTRDLMLEHEKIRERQRRGLPPQQRRNPPVREIFETFNGRPATKTTSVEAPRRTPARVAQLGRLRLIRTADGRTWRFPGDRAPFLAADSRGKLHVVGGQYRANPAGEECGEIEQIEYQTSKPHLGHDHETIYYHQLGEETGERPVLEITPEGELQIIGGNYRIEADGIHN